MEFLTIILLAIALSFDALAVSIALSLSGVVKNNFERQKMSVSFGVFQATMPIIGYYAVNALSIKEVYVKYVSAALLIILAIKFIYEALKQKPRMCKHEFCQEDLCDKVKCDQTGKKKRISFKELIVYSFSTSIDALIAGPVIYALGYNIFICVITIFTFTYVFSIFGSRAHKFVNNRFSKITELLAGSIFVIMAINVIFK